MTPQEFCAWLDGYLQGAKKPDLEVIKAKARDIIAAKSSPQPLQPSVPGMWWPSPSVPQYPTYPIITCDSYGSSSSMEMVDYPPWPTENGESGMN